MIDEVGRFLVCKVGGHDYYGNEYEYVAARMNKGDRVIFKGSEETVDHTWFYEGPIVKLANGDSIHPALGDTFHLVPNEPGKQPGTTNLNRDENNG